MHQGHQRRTIVRPGGAGGPAVEGPTALAFDHRDEHGSSRTSDLLIVGNEEEEVEERHDNKDHEQATEFHL